MVKHSGMATEMRMVLSAKEYVLVGLTLLLIPTYIGQAIGIYEIRQLFHEDKFEHMPQPVDCLIGLSWAFVIMAARYVLTKAFMPLGRMVLSPKKRINVDRVERFATVLFKFLYFVVITTGGYWIMHDQPWFPTVLGGSGSIDRSFEGFLAIPMWTLKHYLLLQLGYHTHSLLYMLFLSPIRNDFIEMLLHHVATVFLIMASYLSNYHKAGSLIVFTHDIGDVTGYAIKAMVDTDNTPLIVVLYLVLLVSWAYSRLYVYPIHLLHGCLYTLPTVFPEISRVFLYSSNCMLGMLQVLHVYWYALFIVMGYALVTRGEKEDIQHRCVDKEAIEKQD